MRRIRNEEQSPHQDERRRDGHRHLPVHRDEPVDKPDQPRPSPQPLRSAIINTPLKNQPPPTSSPDPPDNPRSAPTTRPTTNDGHQPDNRESGNRRADPGPVPDQPPPHPSAKTLHPPRENTRAKIGAEGRSSRHRPAVENPTETRRTTSPAPRQAATAKRGTSFRIPPDYPQQGNQPKVSRLRNRNEAQPNRSENPSPYWVAYCPSRSTGRSPVRAGRREYPPLDRSIERHRPPSHILATGDTPEPTTPQQPLEPDQKNPSPFTSTRRSNIQHRQRRHKRSKSQQPSRKRSPRSILIHPDPMIRPSTTTRGVTTVRGANAPTRPKTRST